jgi:hypothetical protein
MSGSSFMYHGCVIPHDIEDGYTIGARRRDQQSETAYVRNILLRTFQKETVEPEHIYEWYNASAKDYRRFIYNGVQRFFKHREEYRANRSEWDL